MPTLEELLNSKEQSLNSFSPSDDESLVDESSLTPEELTAATALGISTKRLSKKAYADLQKKAEGIVKQASIKPEKTTQELAEGLVKKGGKSAEASAKQFVKAQPSLGFPTKDVAEAVGDSIPSDVFKSSSSAARSSVAKSPFLSRIASLASSPAGKSVLKGLGLAGAVSGLYGDLSEEQDEPADAQMSPMAIANTAPGKSIAPFTESDERTLKQTPKQFASSAYDSLDQIKSDVQKQPLNTNYLRAISDELQKKDAYLNQLKTRSDLVPEEKARLWDTYVAQNQDKQIEERALEKSREIDSEASNLKNQISNLQNKIDSETNPFLKDSLAKTLAQKTQQLNSLQRVDEEQQRLVAAPQQSQSELVQKLMSQPSAEMQPVPTAVPAQTSEAESLKPTKRAISAGEPSASDVQKRDREESLSKIIGADAARQVAERESLLARFKEAQQRENLAQLGISLGQAGEKFGSSLAMVKPGDQSFYEQQRKLAGGFADQVKDEEAVRQEAEKNDPNSALSKQYQELVKSMGVPVKGNESAATLIKALPFLQQYQSQKENREARKEQAALEREKIAATKALLIDEKANKEFKDMSQKLTSEIASSRSAFGKGANIVRSAEAIEKLVEGIDPKDIDVRQITEIARNLDAMLSQGAATISGTKKLIPSSFAGDAAKIAEYITSQPKGARQGEFVKRMIETVEREKELAKQQIIRTQNKILAGYGHLKEKYPSRYNEILEEHEIPISKQEIKQKEKNSKIEAAAKQAGMTYEQMEKYLKDTGQIK